ncbi:MAG: hypothetical protein K6G30_05345, partial [Acetatifactor sp.]|nr:hypothetical protein [Acetatifactor sp.]
VELWHGTVGINRILQLVIVILLQEFWFCRFYGRADCHAFSYCAILETTFGCGMMGYLMQMSIAFLLLFFVQLCRRNINMHGNLKNPVAFLPYISISFLFLLVLSFCF